MPESSIARRFGRRASPRARAAIGALCALVACLALSDSSPRAGGTLALVAGGDVLLDRSGGAGSPFPAADPRFDAIAAAASGASAFLFNLETTIGEGGSPKAKRYVFRARREALRALARLPRPLASLANNHSMDYGPEGLASTLRALESEGALFAGAGADGGAAAAPTYFDTDGGRIAVISRGVDDDPASFAGPGPVIAPIVPASLLRSVAEAKREARAVVVMLHWGIEYSTDFEADEATLARACADAGADLVVGTGPHVLRGVELRGGCLICYSLGNLVFDDLGSEETATALLVRMRWPATGGRPGFAVAPLASSLPAEGPRPLELGKAREVVGRLARRSPDPGLFEGARPALSNGIWFFELRSRQPRPFAGIPLVGSSRAAGISMPRVATKFRIATAAPPRNTQR